jgi:hypothetical protein
LTTHGPGALRHKVARMKDGSSWPSSWGRFIRVWRKGPLAGTCPSLKPNLMDVGGLRTHINFVSVLPPVPALSAAPVPLELGPFLWGSQSQNGPLN